MPSEMNQQANNESTQLPINKCRQKINDVQNKRLENIAAGRHSFL